MVSLRQYSVGEVIIRENESGESAFVIVQGRVAVTKEASGGSTHLAFLGAGMTFGEMSMVDDKPRSATVTAVEETTVREIHRDGFHALIKENPDAVMNLLRAIFERLRQANTAIAAFQAQGAGVTTPAVAPASPVAPKPPVQTAAACISVEGLTPKAVAAMPVNPFVFREFPLNIGRTSSDPLVNNDLEIADSAPLQVSRHHVSIVNEGGRIGVVDRGSQLGTLVNGRRIGGHQADPGPVFIEGDSCEIVLGAESSKYRYRVRVSR